MRARDIPNLITVGRILLVAPTTWALLQQHYRLALVLFLVAGISDGVDGFLAKHYNWSSRLGALLDPVADKALLVCSYAALTWTGLLPLWLFVLVILRDTVIVGGAMVAARLDRPPGVRRGRHHGLEWYRLRGDMEPAGAARING
jgi:cardiolipin synthase